MSYSVGDSVTGVVNGVTAYGAFVRLDDGSNGMIHISKLSKSFVSDIHSVIKKGDVVTATVIGNTENKIALSLIGTAQKGKNRSADETHISKNSEPLDFESMLSAFKSVSEEKLASMNRKDRGKRRK